MKRRTVITASPALVACPALLLAPATSQAVWPWIMRLIFGGVVRGTVTRTVTATVTRSFVATASLGLQGVGLAAVAVGVAKAAEKHKADNVWVAGSAQHELKIAADVGPSAEREQVYLGYRVVDLASGEVERIRLKSVSTEPDKGVSLTHIVRDLKYTGPKFVEGVASLDPKGEQPHPRFASSGRRVVIVARPDEVELS